MSRVASVGDGNTMLNDIMALDLSAILSAIRWILECAFLVCGIRYFVIRGHK